MPGNKRRKRRTRQGAGSNKKFKGYIQPLPTKFDCPFCNQVESCYVTMDRPRKVGVIQCHICHEAFKCKIEQISDPIDVYNEWIDACEAANPDPVPGERPTNLGEESDHEYQRSEVSD